MQAYECLIQVDWQPLILIGINETMEQIASTDLQLWRKNFLRFSPDILTDLTFL